MAFGLERSSGIDGTGGDGGVSGIVVSVHLLRLPV